MTCKSIITTFHSFLNAAAKKFAVGSEGMAEGGCGGNSAMPERNQIVDSPAVLLEEAGHHINTIPPSSGRNCILSDSREIEEHEASVSELYKLLSAYLSKISRIGMRRVHIVRELSRFARTIWFSELNRYRVSKER